MGSYTLTLNMKALVVLLLVSCILVEARMPGKNRNKKQRVTRGRHSERGERVWHVAGSAEECGDASATLYQSHDKPHDLCNEVNATVSVCATRDTEVVAAVTEATEEADDNVEGEPRHLDGEMYQPKEDAKWEFKSGTCVFRLSMDQEEGDEGHDKVHNHEHSRKKVNKKNKKKVEQKRNDRTKLRKKFKGKINKNAKSHVNRRQRKQSAPQPRTEN